jgi:hypothetical protein
MRVKLFTESEELAVLGMLDTTRNIDSHRLVHGGTGDRANTLFAKITLIFHGIDYALRVLISVAMRATSLRTALIRMGFSSGLILFTRFISASSLFTSANLA